MAKTKLTNHQIEEDTINAGFLQGKRASEFALSNHNHFNDYIELPAETDLNRVRNGKFLLRLLKKYYNAPKWDCGTCSRPDELVFGYLISHYHEETLNCIQEIHAISNNFFPNRKYIRSGRYAFNELGGEWIWENWERVLTCKDFLGRDAGLEEENTYNYWVGEFNSNIIVNDFIAKKNIINVCLDYYSTTIGAILNINIWINPNQPNVDVDIFNGDNIPMIFSASFYTDPKTVNDSIYLIKYECFRCQNNWLVGNKVYYN